MKSILYGTVSLLSFASAIAVPADTPKAQVATSPVEERTLFKLWVRLTFLFFNIYVSPLIPDHRFQNPGYKPYKYKLYCPGKPAHDKYLCEKPGNDNEPSYLGWKGDGQEDFQWYLSIGNGDDQYGYNEYTGGNKPDPKPKEVCLAGPKGYESICPVYEPSKYKFPLGWEYKYKAWYITPIYKILAWLEITLSFLKQVHYWQAPKGYKWICYEDGKGGYDVKVLCINHTVTVSK